ncbi:MAG: YicC/YloC family endoribonuclease [Myxococcota bacterium]|nr:YicC/YloC family endoribonuclease [Myxococcota bacterium]
MVMSMTGFGRGRIELNNRGWELSLKSVNHRGLDLRLQLPSPFEGLTAPVEARLRRALGRGRVELRIEITSKGGDAAALQLDEVRAAALIELSARLESLGARPTFGSAELLAWPGLLREEREHTEPEALKEALLIGLEEALVDLESMRRHEGVALRGALEEGLKRCEAIRTQVEMRWPMLAQRYEARLRARLNELLDDGNLDEGRLYAEVALLAERADIHEELVRLKSHLDHFARLLKEDGVIGRRLDFLCQELLRESNTIGSKAQEQKVTPLVIELKGEIERLREQSANLE